MLTYVQILNMIDEYIYESKAPAVNLEWVVALSMIRKLVIKEISSEQLSMEPKILITTGNVTMEYILSNIEKQVNT